ncbi:MAG: phosphate ABC transporter permease subunit PstC [Treponema sp.]|nr:phosphate ABC transporter permease subunit PstC [Treponema sp.]
MNRKFTDVFFKHLFSIVALFSVLALGAILLFVFIQGTVPFFTPTAAGIRLVPQRIDELTVNGELYLNHSSFITIPKNTEIIAIKFPVTDGEESLVITVYDNEKDPQKKLGFSASSEVTATYPESYVHTVSWPAAIAALEKRIYIILPEPPYSIGGFLAGLTWRPNKDKVYGILPMIAGTLMASFGAIVLGVPIALLCALFMAEFLKSKHAAVVRAGVELLAGIPSVVYGFFGLMVIVPFVRNTFNIPSGNTLLSAIIVLALMILPTVITIAETSLRAVPLSVREASLSLGASRMQTAWNVVLPHANSGVIAGIILGISRAVGETMAVILVAGNSPHLTFNPLESVRTLTATIAMEMGYASGRHSEMLFSIGVALFSIILILNNLILWYRRRMEVEL